MITKKFLKRVYFFSQSLAAKLLFPVRALLFRLSASQKNKLHLGCGKRRFEGWINADIVPFAELIIFLQKRLPFADRKLRAIYSEHVMEHVDFPTARFHLMEAHRVLADDGVLRIAMPDLDDIVACYTTDWRRMDWVNWPEFAHVRSGAQAINMAFRDWGHCYLYNRQEIEYLLRSVGFTRIAFEAFGASTDPELRGLEARSDSKLIVEARK